LKATTFACGPAVAAQDIDAAASSGTGAAGMTVSTPEVDDAAVASGDTTETAVDVNPSSVASADTGPGCEVENTTETAATDICRASRDRNEATSSGGSTTRASVDGNRPTRTVYATHTRIEVDDTASTYALAVSASQIYLTTVLASEAGSRLEVDRTTLARRSRSTSCDIDRSTSGASV
jgi:hypothetical protein